VNAEDSRQTQRRPDDCTSQQRVLHGRGTGACGWEAQHERPSPRPRPRPAKLLLLCTPPAAPHRPPLSCSGRDEPRRSKLKREPISLASFRGAPVPGARRSGLASPSGTGTRRDGHTQHTCRVVGALLCVGSSATRPVLRGKQSMAWPPAPTRGRW